MDLKSDSRVDSWRAERLHLLVKTGTALTLGRVGFVRKTERVSL